MRERMACVRTRSGANSRAEHLFACVRAGSSVVTVDGRKRLLLFGVNAEEGDCVEQITMKAHRQYAIASFFPAPGVNFSH